MLRTFERNIFQIPIVDHKVKMISDSNLIWHFYSFGVNIAHHGDQHVEQMYEQNERWHIKENDQKRRLLPVSVEKAIDIDLAQAKLGNVEHSRVELCVWQAVDLFCS